MENQIYQEINLVQDKHWWFKGRRRVFERMVGLYLPPSGKFKGALDVGCGPGVNLGMLQMFAHEIGGLDNSDRAVLLAKQNYPSAAVFKSELLSFQSNSKYDLITLLDVLEHIEDDCSALRKIEDLLLPGGIAVIMVPAFNFFWTRHDERLGHYRRYTISGLRDKICASTSLSIERISYFNFFLFLPMLLFRLVKKMGRRDGQSDFFMPLASINYVLMKIFFAEARLMRFINLPFGVSIICVLRKK